MLDKLTLESFQPHLNQKFTIHAQPGVEIESVLKACEGLGTGPERGRARQFRLLFLGPLQPIFPQRIYRVENREFGSVEMFLVPIGPQDGGMRYEAVFT